VVSGKELVQVPQLTGVPEADAIRAITDAKLALGIRTESFDEGIVAGSLIGTAIPAGTEVPTGTAIDYEVSRGLEPTPTHAQPGRPRSRWARTSGSRPPRPAPRRPSRDS
jgi:serine/threonine-protein kinase